MPGVTTTMSMMRGIPTTSMPRVTTTTYTREGNLAKGNGHDKPLAEDEDDNENANCNNNKEY